MKAEEAGDISLAVKAFEDAVALPGPYTDELKGILQSYYEALGIKGQSPEKPWSFRFLGDAGFSGLRYDEFSDGNGFNEYGGDAFLSLTPFLDYTLGNWLHSFGLEVSGDWFLMNDNMPALDTSDWILSVGADYSLIGTSVMANVGINLNLAEREDPSLSFFGWGQKEFYRGGKNRYGAALWAYYKTNGPLSSALYASWNRSAANGWNGSLYVGGRFEADSVLDYKKYVSDYVDAVTESVNNAYDSGLGLMDAYGNCWATYGSACMELTEEQVDSLYWEKLVGDATKTVSVPSTRSYGLWLGPVLRLKISYKFRTKITLEAKVNLFYGFVLDGPDADYEKIQKFSGSWGAMIYWNPNFLRFYLGVEQNYHYYRLPAYYRDVYPEGNLLSQLKAGVKWEI